MNGITRLIFKEFKTQVCCNATGTIRKISPDSILIKGLGSIRVWPNHLGRGYHHYEKFMGFTLKLRRILPIERIKTACTWSKSLIGYVKGWERTRAVRHRLMPRLSISYTGKVIEGREVVSSQHLWLPHIISRVRRASFVRSRHTWTREWNSPLLASASKT